MEDSDWQIKFDGDIKKRNLYMLEKKHFVNCKFLVGEDNEQKEFYAHKLILASASPVFERMFYGEFVESKSKANDKPIEVPDVKPNTFEIMLSYIYADRVIIKTYEDATDLYYIAEKYMFPGLASRCTEFMEKVLSLNNVLRTYELADLYNQKDLKQKCMQMIVSDTIKVLTQRNFIDINLSTLMDILDQNKLNINSELDLFYALLRFANKRVFFEGKTAKELSDLNSLATSSVRLNLNSSATSSGNSNLNSSAISSGRLNLNSSATSSGNSNLNSSATSSGGLNVNSSAISSGRLNSSATSNVRSSTPVALPSELNPFNPLQLNSSITEPRFIPVPPMLRRQLNAAFGYDMFDTNSNYDNPPAASIVRNDYNLYSGNPIPISSPNNTRQNIPIPISSPNNTKQNIPIPITSPNNTIQNIQIEKQNLNKTIENDEPEPVYSRDEMIAEDEFKKAVRKIRFLTMTPKDFSEGPAKSILLNKDEKLAIFIIISSNNNQTDLPDGFTCSRESRRTVCKRSYQ